MIVDITQLQTFLAAAATGSFAEAAERVNASPSTVTERIKQLEYRVGAKLFTRNKRGCTLTVAGTRFAPFARQSLRGWELARETVALPERFTATVSIGGQYVFWDSGLADWIGTLQADLPEVAFRLTAGASARLNRDISGGFLDLVILYDPEFHRDIRAEPVFEDELILVTGGEVANWRDDYVRIEWGDALAQEIGMRMEALPQAGLVLDLGVRSAEILIAQGKCGFIPKTKAQPLIDAGLLKPVPDTPVLTFPAYVCWRRDLDDDIAARIIASIRAYFGGSQSDAQR